MKIGYEKQLKRGVLELVILSIICREASYGYKILKILNSTKQGFFDIKEGTLYPILYRLEDEGLIRSRWGENINFDVDIINSRSEKPKKMYSATAKGHIALIERQNIWQEFQKTTNDLLG